MSEVAQLCPTLCDPIDSSLPGFSVHGIFQARVPACHFPLHQRRGSFETPGESFGTGSPRLGSPVKLLLFLPSRPVSQSHTLSAGSHVAECLAKAEGCWKSGCFLGGCLACPLKVKLGAPGRCPRRRQAGVAPALGCEWNPLLNRSLFLSSLFAQPTMAGWCQGEGSDHPCCLSPVILREGPAGHSSFWKSKISHK